MKPRPRFALLCFVAAISVLVAADEYPPGPDSQVQPGVPQGELIKFEFSGSKIFPGTTREVSVYVPRQYDPARPACVYVNQDGLQWNANVVFDNLIARGELPVIVGVFVRPGVVKAADPTRALDRFNRSFEYDGLGDAYARFLLEEVLPAVATKSTSDGRAIRLSASGNDRAIGGSSSGAIAAFTAAWERPDAFTRVFSCIGTYVGLRGGDRYPTLIRKTEPKPLRIFLQDGEQDLNIYAGDWWLANHTMLRALTYASYEVRHVWGGGGHNGRHGTMLFPEAMRWLWHDWPRPVRAGTPRTPRPHSDSGGGLATRRRGLSPLRRHRRQCAGRGLLHRHSQQQGLQDRRRWPARGLPRRHEARQRPGVWTRRPAVRRRHRHPAGARL
jgi:enterochelin esterase-like enzyme